MRTVFSDKRSAATNIPRFQPELAFPVLGPDLIARFQRFGTIETCQGGALLFQQGQKNADMFVIREGTLTLYATGRNGERLYESILGPGQFTGELDLLSSRSALLNAECSSDCVTLRIDRSGLQAIMREEADIANLIMQASMWRRLQFLGQTEGGLLVLGPPRDAEVLRIRRFLTQNCYPHQVLQPGTKEGLQYLPLSENSANLPLVVLADGTVLEQPSLLTLAESLGVTDEPEHGTKYDLVVVGAGPGGLAAAVYGASEGLRTLVVEGVGPGGQAGTSSRIENYLGFPTGVSGEELAYRAQVQAQKFGAQLTIAREAIAIRQSGQQLCITLTGGLEICARAVVVATGAQYRKLDAENYAAFEGHGIHYAATAMEGNLSRGSVVAVIGGGNSAGQAAVFLSGLAEHVHLIVRRESLHDTMSQYLISRILASDSITLHTSTEVMRLDGERDLREISLVNTLTGMPQQLDTENLFVMIGAEPNTGWLYGSVALNRKGFIRTGADVGFESSRYATSLRGVFAVGDVRADSVKRVASAVGEGSVVISDIHRYLAAETLETVAAV